MPTPPPSSLTDHAAYRTAGPPGSFRRTSKGSGAILTVICLGLTACGGTAGHAGSAADSGATAEHADQAAVVGPGGLRDGARLNVARLRRRRLVRVATCLRSDGVALPPPGRADGGPIIDLHEVDTGRHSFTAAWSRCRTRSGATSFRPFKGPVPSGRSLWTTNRGGRGP
jgi:hypothetical protein